MLTNEEIIWLGRDNSIDLLLYENSSAADLVAVTEIRLRLGGVVIASTSASAGLIRWNQAGYATGEVRIIAGGATVLSTGRFKGALVVMDPSNATGIVWDDNVPIRVKSDPLAT